MIEYNIEGPKYWKFETSGRLAAAVKAYFRPYQEVMISPSIELTETHLLHLRAYLSHWAEAPCWRLNPHSCSDHLAALDKLANDAKAINCRKDIDQWIEQALDLGIDPF